jgi:hypothetical protein
VPSSKFGSITIICRRPGRAPFRAVALEDMANIVRTKRRLMATKREEMKALRLKAMGVVGEHMDANANMFHRIIEAGDEVTKARERAEAAHMGALSEQVGDLNEMADEMAEFAQAVPTSGGKTQPAATAKPATSSGDGLKALALLQAAQPNPPAKKHAVGEMDEDGNAYHGTAPPTL